MKILITGVSRGIGHALAAYFLSQGDTVIGVGRTAPSFIEDSGIFTFISCDFFDDEETESAVNSIKKLGTIDTFIHNAMYTPKHKLFLRYKAEELEKAHRVCSVIPLRFVQAIYSGQKKQSFGRVIFLGSLMQSIGGKGQLVYITAKSALSGLTKSLALEMASHGITVNLLLLGPVITEHFSSNVTAENQQKLQSAIPTGAFISYREIIHNLEYLLSKEACNMTGTEIPLGGGAHLGGSR